MTHLTSRIWACLLVVFVGLSSEARAQDGPLKVATLSEAAPESLEAPVREALSGEGYQVTDAQGAPFLQFWLRKDIPVSGEPSGPQGAVLYPVLKVGELIGAVEFKKEGYDYRDQPITEGTYTLRYGLQPVNGDHLGVSTHRDYLLLVPADQDVDLEPIDQETLDVVSSDAAMTNHPAVFLLKAAPEGADDAASVVHDAVQDQWGVVLPLPIKIDGKETSGVMKVQLIVVGHGPV